MHALVLLCINQHTKFELHSFTNSKDMIGTKLKNGSRDSHHVRYGVLWSSKVKHLIYSMRI